MEISLLILGLALVLAIAVGALLGYLFTKLRAQAQIAQLRIELQTERARGEALAKQEQERAAMLEQAEARLKATFEHIASEKLRANNEIFLQLARETLGRDQAIAQSAWKESEAAIAQLVLPLRMALEKTEQQVQAMERERRELLTSLRSQIEGLASGQAQLQRETRNLVTALRRPEVRGRWGELTLRRVVELAGMAEHCDFTEQPHVSSDEGGFRPDLVVHMPDARDLVVDVKAPLDAYLEAVEAVSEEDRRAALKRHAQQVETRVRQLGSKNYWAQFENSPEFAVLFLPGDQFLSAALAERPELLENALRQRVIIATPTTLIALLKAVAHGWRQSAAAENAATIRELGQEMYRRLSSFTGHLAKLGQRLGSAVEVYNSAVGSLERFVLPHARRFPELGATTDEPLPSLDPVAQLTRTPNTALEAPNEEVTESEPPATNNAREA